MFIFWLSILGNPKLQERVRAIFGKTKEVLRAVRTREDFLEAAKTINEDNDNNEDGVEMFDMRDLMLGMNVDEEIEE